MYNKILGTYMLIYIYIYIIIVGRKQRLCLQAYLSTDNINCLYKLLDVGFAIQNSVKQ